MWRKFLFAMLTGLTVVPCAAIDPSSTESAAEDVRMLVRSLADRQVTNEDRQMAETNQVLVNQVLNEHIRGGLRTSNEMRGTFRLALLSNDHVLRQKLVTASLKRLASGEISLGKVELENPRLMLETSRQEVSRWLESTAESEELLVQGLQKWLLMAAISQRTDLGKVCQMLIQKSKDAEVRTLAKSCVRVQRGLIVNKWNHDTPIDLFKDYLRYLDATKNDQLPDTEKEFWGGDIFDEDDWKSIRPKSWYAEDRSGRRKEWFTAVDAARNALAQNRVHVEETDNGNSAYLFVDDKQIIPFMKDLLGRWVFGSTAR